MSAVGLMCVLPVLLAACTLTGSAVTGAPPATAPSGPSNLLYIKGSATPSSAVPVAPYPAASAVVLKPPTFPSASAASVSNYPFAGYCPGQLYQGKDDGLAVVGGNGQATVSWYNANNIQIIKYSVTAVSQRLVYGPQPIGPVVTLGPGRECQLLTATVKNLRHKTWYVFWLDAVTYLYYQGQTRDYEIARSNGVYIS